MRQPFGRSVMPPPTLPGRSFVDVTRWVNTMPAVTPITRTRAIALDSKNLDIFLT